MLPETFVLSLDVMFKGIGQDRNKLGHNNDLNYVNDEMYHSIHLFIYIKMYQFGRY